MKDEPLREYTLYWRAQVERAQGKEAAALTDLETIRRDYPDSAITEQVVEALAATALSLRKPQEAVAAPDAHPHKASKPRPLFQPAHARPGKGAPARAAEDYQAGDYRLCLVGEGPPPRA